MRYPGNVVAPVLGIVLGLVVMGVGVGVVVFRSTGDRITSDPAVLEPTHTAAVPPIDASAPMDTETATFALG